MSSQGTDRPSPLWRVDVYSTAETTVLKVPTRRPFLLQVAPWKSGALAPRQNAFDLGFSRGAYPKATTGAKAHLHSMRNAALEGPLFHVGVNSGDVLLEFLSPLRGWSLLARPPTAGAVGCILAPVRGWQRLDLPASAAACDQSPSRTV